MAIEPVLINYSVLFFMATPCVWDHITDPSTMHSYLHLVLPPCPLPLQWVLVTRRVLITLHRQQTMPIEPALIYYSILSGSCTFTFYIPCVALLIDDLELGCQDRVGSNIYTIVCITVSKKYSESSWFDNDFWPISFRDILVLGHSYDCCSTSEYALKDMNV